ncbi:MAG: isoprenylcysteine carboxylmethyltransferase family protein [Burkholderiales bacterium]|nr:MAG: isoprenylcysteine carboxylmethyltransferase family protein [Burkholderiales bacterium]
MGKLENLIPPPVVAALVAALMWWLSGLPPAWPWPAGERTALVLALVALGLAFDLSGLLVFLRQRTTINPLRPHRASSLATAGVYRITRNPMYVGLCCLLLAWAVHLWSPWALAGPLLFVAYITRFQIVPEERALEALFGEQYRAYRARVRRWL